ncbi:MAG: dTDP-4-amino-4,6-dideoxygalactose transaminase [Thermoanaerobaculia bacterium]|jgi:dTDP-4-amino-4,6-dideoxygalactose transaminase
MLNRIPFNRPVLVGHELDYIQQAIRGQHASGNGPFTKRVEADLEQILGAPRILLTTSCTHALEMSARLLDLAPGDEVIVPSLTFVTTAAAFALHGGTPVFVDVRPDTLNLDEQLLAAAITPRTRAIVAVHYAGIGCSMEAILEIASRRGIVVIEDNAHGLFGSWNGRPLGSFGALSTLSFHETKNVSCGEGGALVLNDASFVPRAEILREKGTNRAKFFRGEVDKYTWVDHGSSWVLSDLLAAYLLAQIEERESIQARRRAIWTAYHTRLETWAGQNGVRLPHLPAQAAPAWHIYALLLPNATSRSRVLRHLGQNGVNATFHYQPLNLSPMGARFGGRAGQCPVAEDVADRLVRLPMYNDMRSEDVEAVIDAVTAFTA